MMKAGTVALKLFLICAVAATSLGVVNAVTEPVIRQRKAAELKAALGELAPGAEVGDAVPVEAHPVVKVRYPVSQGGAAAGAILQLAATGYGGDMKVLARLGADGTIQAVKLMDNSETPGLGRKAEDPAYMQKFIGTGAADRPVPVRKASLSPEQADAISGATITYLGISRALAEAARFVREVR